MHFSPVCHYFIPLRTTCSPQHPVLKHPQSMFLNVMLGGSLVTTAWRVLRLRMEETASRYGG
jgi:hypothetical protein